MTADDDNNNNRIDHKYNNNNNDNNAAVEAEEQNEPLLLSHMTTFQKLTLLNGADLWSLHPICTSTASIRLSDGPHGVRKPLSDFGLNDAHPSTCFPSACATACSWNPTLLQRLGSALAEECHLHDVQVILGPGVNLKRYPAGGRSHEYFSEDPYLTGRLAMGYIRGAQQPTDGGCGGGGGGVAACIKHFAINNQESHRMVVDVIVDERVMRELYLRAFEMAIDTPEDPQQQQPRLVMAAYNQVNGTFCSENSYLLDQILRKEWNYAGVVVSDWGAVNDRAKGIQAGMDLEMPGNFGACHDEIVIKGHHDEDDGDDGDRLHADDAHIESNRSEQQRQQHLHEVHIHASADRVARLVKDYQPKTKTTTENNNDDDVVDIERPVSSSRYERELFERHHQLAHEMATECIVLLQNRDNLLPLSLERRKRVALIGDFGKDNPRYQGMGSAKVTPTRMANVYDELQNAFRVAATPAMLSFAPGYDVDGENDEIDQDLIDNAVANAQEADVTLVFVGLPEIMESEGFDRPHCRLPQQHISLVEAVCRVNSEVVVILSNGGVVEIPESIVQAAKAILEGFLLGQAGGSAMVDVLVGKISPSGKLPETIAVNTHDIPAHHYFPGTRHKVEHREGLDVGYRYFSKRPASETRFPFGHGLQYTTFDYRNVRVSVECDEVSKKLVKVSVDVQNTGTLYTAKEVVQLYVKAIGSAVYRPAHELKAFEKVDFAPGEIKTVTFELNERAFAFYDIGAQDWVIESGPSCSFEIQVGGSSRDIRQRQTISFSTGQEATALARESYPPSEVQEYGASSVEDGVFAKRFGTLEISVLDALSRSKQEHVQELTVHRNTLLKEAAGLSILGWILFQATYGAACSEVKRGVRRKRELRMIRANVENLPLRVLVLFAKGNLSFRLLDGLILFMNGFFFLALRSMFTRSKRQVKRRADSDTIFNN